MATLAGTLRVKGKSVFYHLGDDRTIDIGLLDGLGGIITRTRYGKDGKVQVAEIGLNSAQLYALRDALEAIIVLRRKVAFYVAKGATLDDAVKTVSENMPSYFEGVA